MKNLKNYEKLKDLSIHNSASEASNAPTFGDTFFNYVLTDP